MPIDAEKLLRFAIPSVRQAMTPKDAAFYALSIGMGRDPIDRKQLPFVDPLAGPAAMPAMALVLAHPGFWLGHPDSGVDPLAVLHAGQALELFGPVPVAGDVESQTRITHLVDKGPGKAALIHSETELAGADGIRFARLDRTTFIRGGGGFGGSDSGPVKASPPQPEGDPDLAVDLPTGREQALIYRLNGDLNPLHSDPDVAAKSGFDQPILHGLCTMGVIVHALLRGLLDYRADRLRAVSLRFASPVIPGETIRTEIWKSGAFRARVVERDVVVADQGWCSSSQD
ncbi:MaoC/PaaZ C-terminal domain-containing protein [Sphingopyxis sp. 550A]